ncbi:hypothetical protein CERSUDRAFT_112618 [Gelatoporia subvermispora B]|uniref:EF-hand domain-containing protein n=1 Tax=Ceriporiopsis subvermispora (strain B) TaxID=914234 RepID=M2RJF4_CERS8|nr:hypothetical protein CERSUDRAFT_112618 [Gelatoporia subvermispora B]
MDVDEKDTQFTALPSRVQRRVDQAFDSAAASTSSSVDAPRIRRNAPTRTQDAEPGGFLPDDTAGGFLVDDSDPAPGGFLVDDATNEPDPQDRLALSQIPSALQLLDLQPDDEDVLSVFRNAASGWNDRDLLRARKQPDEELFVYRRDWRAVCAVLLDTGEDADEEDRRESDAASRADDVMIEDDVSSGEEYVEPEGEESEPEENDAESDDEYVEGGSVVRAKSKAGGKQRASRRAARESSPLSTDGDDDRPRPLSARQKQECRRAFRLFFPGVSDGELDRQRIMIKDITRVAQLLGEKITAEETVEMLEAFASSADKSMGLADFERMMLAARLA